MTEGDLIIRNYNEAPGEDMSQLVDSDGDRTTVTFTLHPNQTTIQAKSKGLIGFIIQVGLLSSVLELRLPDSRAWIDKIKQLYIIGPILSAFNLWEVLAEFKNLEKLDFQVFRCPGGLPAEIAVRPLAANPNIKDIKIYANSNAFKTFTAAAKKSIILVIKQGLEMILKCTHLERLTLDLPMGDGHEVYCALYDFLKRSKYMWSTIRSNVELEQIILVYPKITKVQGTMTWSTQTISGKFSQKRPHEMTMVHSITHDFNRDGAYKFKMECLGEITRMTTTLSPNQTRIEVEKNCPIGSIHIVGLIPIAQQMKCEKETVWTDKINHLKINGPVLSGQNLWEMLSEFKNLEKLDFRIFSWPEGLPADTVERPLAINANIKDIKICSNFIAFKTRTAVAKRSIIGMIQQALKMTLQCTNLEWLKLDLPMGNDHEVYRALHDFLKNSKYASSTIKTNVGLEQITLVYPEDVKDKKTQTSRGLSSREELL